MGLLWGDWVKARISTSNTQKEGFIDSTNYISKIHIIQYEAGTPFIEEHMDCYVHKYNETVDKFNYCIDEKMLIRGVFAFREPILPHINADTPTSTTRIQRWDDVKLQRDSNGSYWDKNNPEVIKQLITQNVLFFNEDGRDITEKLKEFLTRNVGS